MKDPRPGLETLGVTYDQVIAPDDGYDGTYTPEVVYLHWTAAAAGSDTAASTVAAHDYHACVARDGCVALGGWNVKQAHGGSGRTAPIGLARQGIMNVDLLEAWQTNPAGDDTDSEPNRYGVAVSIDCNGVGEEPTSTQWHAFTATAAVLLDCLGRTSPGYLIDHATSTNRKVDLTGPVLPPARWYADIGTQLALLQGGPMAVNSAVDLAATPSGRGYFILGADGGIFTYGDALYRGALTDYRGEHPPTGPAVALEATADDGYLILTATGQVFPFGTAGWCGSPEEDWT